MDTDTKPAKLGPGSTIDALVNGIDAALTNALGEISSGFGHDAADAVKQAKDYVSAIQMMFDTADAAAEPTFEGELRSLINRYSLENGSDTPDSILAQYLVRCVTAFDHAVGCREIWYGREDPGAAITPVDVTTAS